MAFILSEVDGPVGRLTLNEPDRLNPVTMERIQELGAAAAQMSSRDDVKVVVVTGAGRAFSAGADLAAPRVPKGQWPPASGSLAGDGPGLWTLTAMRQPVIAMVRGAAIGYGFELALQADLRFAGTSAKFGAPFAALGTVSDTGAGSWLLPRLVGWSKAAEMLYSGRHYSAQAALAMGLVNAVFDDSELEHEVMAFAREMAANSAWSLRTLKRMIFDGLQQSSGAHILEQYRQVNRGDPTVDLSSLRQRFRTTRAPS